MNYFLPLITADKNAYETLLKLEEYTENAALPITIKNLIKIRASQINKCEYCLTKHINVALCHGETQKRIDELGNWQISTLFNEREKIVLELTDNITLISFGEMSRFIYKRANIFYTSKELSHIIMQIITINAWNRMALSGILESNKQTYPGK